MAQRGKRIPLRQAKKQAPARGKRAQRPANTKTANVIKPRDPAHQLMVDQLVELGIRQDQAASAAKITGYQSIDIAMEYIAMLNSATQIDVQAPQPKSQMDVVDFINKRIGSNAYHQRLVKPDLDCLQPYESIMTRIVDDMGEIAELFGIGASNASFLLRKFRWNKEMVIERYYDENWENKLPSTDQTPPPFTSTKCVIWDEEDGPFISLDCKHEFCKLCWKENLEHQITNGKADSIKWMQANCPTLVCDPRWLKDIVDYQMLKKFMTFWVNLFVEVNPVYKRCPSPNWTFVIQSDGSKPSIRCECGYHMWSRCPRESHMPATCEEMKKYEDQAANEGENLSWVMINTQDCPKWKWPIEKNGGCNHIDCHKWGHAFCWIWLEPSNHQDFCQTESVPKAWQSKNFTQARNNVDHFLKFYNKITAHEMSQEFEVKLKEQARQHQDILLMSQVNDKAIEITFEAAENLCECRRMLRNSYVASMHMLEDSTKQVFEYSQWELEKATERLSKVLEKKGSIIDVENLRIISNTASQRYFNLIEIAQANIASKNGTN